MDLTHLLRSQARRYKCTVCQENMADCDINVLTQQANRALVKVTCTACKDENLLQVIFQGEDDDRDTEELTLPRPSLFDEPRPAIQRPITADEMLDLHGMLEKLHRGGFRDLVSPER